MTKLILIKTLKYYDVPQILVAADATGTNYLCTLYQNDTESGYHYFAVQTRKAELTEEERDEVVTNCDHLQSLKFRPTLPYAFTEQGIGMLSVAFSL